MSERLKIVAWNIFMMPSFAFQSPSNSARARALSSGTGRQVDRGLNVT